MLLNASTYYKTVKAEIKEIREKVKLKGDVPVSQLVDYKLLMEVLAAMKR